MQANLKRKNGRYYWRVRVPADLIGLVGRAELCRALNTEDSNVAKRRAKLVGFRADQAFHVMRTSQLSTEEIDSLVRRVLKDELERHEKNLIARPRFGPQALADGLDSEVDKWRDAPQRDEWWKETTEEVQAIAARYGIALNPSSDEYRDRARISRRQSSPPSISAMMPTQRAPSRGSLQEHDLDTNTFQAAGSIVSVGAQS